MQLFDDWIKDNDKPFLLLGKGPTIEKITGGHDEKADQFLLSKYTSIGLNHIGENLKIDIAHVIDIEVLEDCGEELFENAKYLLVPWFMNRKYEIFEKHINNIISEGYPCTRSDVCNASYILKKFQDENRLLIWNRKLPINPFAMNAIGGSCALRDRDDKLGRASNIETMSFCGDSTFNLLCALGERKVYSLGVDGGKEYSEYAKGQSQQEPVNDSFDEQFGIIKHLSLEYGSEFIKLGDLETIKIFVGASPKEYIPAKVLEYSIKKNTTHPVSFHFMNDLPPHRMPRDQHNQPRTKFSFQRFRIPFLAKQTWGEKAGKAFYLDSDMVVFKDMSELLGYEFNGHDAIGCADMDKYSKWSENTRQLFGTSHGGSDFAVLMLNYNEIKWDINSIVSLLDEGKMTYEELMYDFKIASVKPAFPPEWNSLETYDEGNTALLHYTDGSAQPWLKPDHPLESIWAKHLKDAIECGHIQKSEYNKHVAMGSIRNVLNWDVPKMSPMERLRARIK